MKRNTTDLAGRHIPDRYLDGLPPALQKQRIRELTESREAYHRGDFSELPTDVTARKMGLVKQSAYTTVAKERGVEWRGDPTDMATRILVNYGHRPTAGEVRQLSEALRKVFSKGLAAWKSGGHRPGATAQNWAVARVNSVAVGGKAAWSTDSREFETMPEQVRRTIQNRLDEVMSALHAQGRQRDVAYLAVAKSGARNNPVTDTESRRKLGSLLYPLIYRDIEQKANRIVRKTSRSISSSVKQELAQGAFEAALDAVFASVMFENDSFSPGNDEAEENLKYAVVISKGAAEKYIIDSARMEVDLRGQARQDEKANIDSTRSSLAMLYGREPTMAELAARLGRTAEELQTILGTRLLPIKHVGERTRVPLSRGPRLMEEQPEEGRLALDLIPDTSMQEEEEHTARMAELRASMASLEPGERQIVQAYLGEIPATSLPYGYDQLQRMVEGTKSRPGLMRKLALITEERRLLEEKGVPRGRLVAR